MFRTTSYQLITPTTALTGITLLMCCFNSVLFILVTRLRQDSCIGKISMHDVTDTQQKQEHWKITERNEAWLVEIAKYKTFNWDHEIQKLFDLIPVLEFRTNSSMTDDTYPVETSAKDNDRVSIIGTDNQKCKKVPYATDKISLQKIVLEIRRINTNYGALYKYQNGIESSSWKNLLKEEVFANGILLCSDLTKVEKSRTNPRIRYTYRAFTQWKGMIKTDLVANLPVKLRRIQRNYKPPIPRHSNNYVALARKDQVPYVDKGFEHGKTELLNVLKMQGWYGIPRLFGVCITTTDGKDVIEASINGDGSLEPHVIRYLVSLHEASFTKMCHSYIPAFQCLNAYPMLGLLKDMENPIEAALKFMLNIATFFNQFQENGGILYEIIGEQLTFNKDFDLMLTDFTTIHFLGASKGSNQTHNGLERLLSGTICKENNECAQAVWQSYSLSYKFGTRCQESRGYCTSENRCWGLDANVHACIMSRWIFSQIQDVVSPDWAYAGNLTEVIQCAIVKSPEERCGWSYIKSTLSDLYKIATSK